MEQLWEDGLVREKDGGSLGLATLSHRGAEKLRETMTTMRLEVPLFTLAEELAEQVDGLICHEIYEEMFNLTRIQSIALCQDSSTTFNFKDKFQSSFALINVYLYGDEFNPDFFAEFSQAVWPDAEYETGRYDDQLGRLITAAQSQDREESHVESDSLMPWQLIGGFQP